MRKAWRWLGLIFDVIGFIFFLIVLHFNPSSFSIIKLIMFSLAGIILGVVGIEKSKKKSDKPGIWLNALAILLPIISYLILFIIALMSW